MILTLSLTTGLLLSLELELFNCSSDAVLSIPYIQSKVRPDSCSGLNTASLRAVLNLRSALTSSDPQLDIC